MYYYKTFYSNGTWDIVNSATPIRTAKAVCQTCTKIQPIGRFKYYWIKLVTFIQFYNK